MRQHKSPMQMAPYILNTAFYIPKGAFSATSQHVQRQKKNQKKKNFHAHFDLQPKE